MDAEKGSSRTTIRAKLRSVPMPLGVRRRSQRPHLHSRGAARRPSGCFFQSEGKLSLGAACRPLRCHNVLTPFTRGRGSHPLCTSPPCTDAARGETEVATSIKSGKRPSPRWWITPASTSSTWTCMQAGLTPRSQRQSSPKKDPPPRWWITPAIKSSTWTCMQAGLTPRSQIGRASCRERV